MFKFLENYQARKRRSAALVEYNRARSHLEYLENAGSEICSGWGEPLQSEEEQLGNARKRLVEAKNRLEETEKNINNL